MSYKCTWYVDVYDVKTLDFIGSALCTGPTDFDTYNEHQRERHGPHYVVDRWEYEQLPQSRVDLAPEDRTPDVLR